RHLCLDLFGEGGERRGARQTLVAVGVERGLEDFGVGTADGNVSAGVELWSQFGSVGPGQVNAAALQEFSAGADGERSFTGRDLLRVSVGSRFAVDAEQS